MKYFCFLITLFVSINLSAQFGLDRVEEFGENKGNLKMYKYVPKTIDYQKPVPLVFVLHGCTQSAEMISSETGWNKLADSLNFIVVYPEQKQINNATKCFNFYLGFKAKKDKGEVASLKNMIDYCFKRYSIDSSRVFITGMSAGGAMSNAMLNAYPEIFNAGAILAGPSNLFNPNKGNIHPKVAILQGTDDRIVPKRNAEKIKLQWLKKHQIDTSQAETIVDYLNNPLLTAKLYYNHEKQVKVITIYAAGIRHKLLIKPGKKLSQGGKMDFHTVDVNFHSTYWIAWFFGLTKL
jgi:poly(3-hydroxybutyrate) depolymerase